MEFSVETDARLTTVDVTAKVREAIPNDCETGVCHCTVKHTTAALVLQEAESRLLGDLESFLDSLVPDEGHAHDEIDDNAAAHLRATLLGPTVTVPVTDGDLDLGTWQSILFVECDGPRRRRVSVRTVPSEPRD